MRPRPTAPPCVISTVAVIIILCALAMVGVSLKQGLGTQTTVSGLIALRLIDHALNVLTVGTPSASPVAFAIATIGARFSAKLGKGKTNKRTQH